MSRATQVLTLLYPDGIPPGEYQAALAVAEIAQRAEQTGAALKLPTPGEYRAAVDHVVLYDPAKTKGPRVKRGQLDVKTVAAQSKVTPQTVYAAIKKGALVAKKVKGEYRVRWADAEKWFGGAA